MSTQQAGRRGRGAVAVEPAPDPQFIPAVEMARELCVATDTLSDWVAKGIWPRPWLMTGKTRLWRREHWREFVETGLWPPEARRDRK